MPLPGPPPGALGRRGAVGAAGAGHPGMPTPAPARELASPASPALAPAASAVTAEPPGAANGAVRPGPVGPTSPGVGMNVPPPDAGGSIPLLIPATPPATVETTGASVRVAAGSTAPASP